MLNGIGGNSIEAARETLSYDEVLQWAEYRRLRGSLNLGSRVEFSVALLIMNIRNMLGGDAKVTDFMPHAQEAVASAADVLNAFKR